MTEWQLGLMDDIRDALRRRLPSDIDPVDALWVAGLFYNLGNRDASELVAWLDGRAEAAQEEVPDHGVHSR